MKTKTKRFGARAIALAAVATAVGVIGSTGMAGAIPPGPQSITVNNETEYRAALATLSAIPVPEGSAPTQNTIVLAADITLTQQGQDPSYNGHIRLQIDGQGHTIDAADKSRVLVSLSEGVAVTLDGVIAKNGRGGGYGGGVYSGGDLTLEDSTVRDSEDLIAGGGVYAADDLVMENSSLIGNSVQHGDNDYSSGGGADAGSFDATASTISGNTADLGGGIRSRGEVHLLASTVSGNTATGGRGYGGGVQGYDITLDNSTVAGNSGEQVGGIVAQTSLMSTLSTIAGNTTTTTGPANVQVLGSGGWSSFASVLADPIGGANCLIGDVPIESAWSWSTDDSCVLEARSDVQNGADPDLGELGDNGGDTETLLPGLGSPLVDRLPNGVCVEGGYSLDQRGEPRPEAADTGCDVGSVEGSGDPAPAAQCFGQDVTVVIGDGDQPTDGTDVILGTEDDDVIDGLGGSDRICGLGGSDTLRGGSGLDDLSGGEGDDDLGGGIGPDTIQGNQGADALFGANGLDNLVGGLDDDRLSGGAADDHLVGGLDTDRCDGGSGSDTRQTCELLVGFP